MSNKTVREILEKNIIVHICTHCGGSGKGVNYRKTITCKKCNGKGYELEVDQALHDLRTLLKLPGKRYKYGYPDGQYNQAIDECNAILKVKLEQEGNNAH